MHNKLPAINQFRACVYALTLSVGQKFRRSLVGSTASRSFMKLQSRRQPGLRCHLKACRGRRESISTREATVSCSLIMEVTAHRLAMFCEKQAARSGSHSRGRRTRVFPTVPETLSPVTHVIFLSILNSLLFSLWVNKLVKSYNWTIFKLSLCHYFLLSEWNYWGKYCMNSHNIIQQMCYAKKSLCATFIQPNMDPKNPT